MATVVGRLKHLAFVIVVAGLPACAPFALISNLKEKEAVVYIEKLNVHIDDEVTLKKPLTVHLVIAYEETLKTRLDKMISEKYFANQKRLEKEYADVCEFFKFEIQPDQRHVKFPIQLKNLKALAGYIFVNYKTPGAHREIIGIDRTVDVFLDKDEFTIVAVKQKERSFEEDFLNIFE